MELFQLKYALMVSKYQNFSRAAEKLFITQPTLSQQIQKLEKEVGFSIFVRTPGKVITTPQGDRFLAGAARVMIEFENLEADIKNISQSNENTIVFGTSPLSSPFISLALPVFKSEYPQTGLRIIEAHDPELIDMVINKEIDLAIVSLPEGHPKAKKLRVFPIQNEILGIIVTHDHPLAENSQVEIAELCKHRLIFFSTKDGTRSMIFDVIKNAGLEPPETIELSNLDAQANLIRGGDVGIALSEQKIWKFEKDMVFVPIVPNMKCVFSVIVAEDMILYNALNGLIDIVAIRQSGRMDFSKKYEAFRK